MTTPTTDWPKPGIAVDLTIMTVTNGALHCVLMQRDDADIAGGDWAFPGGFVRPDISLDATVTHVLQHKTGLADVHFEQLATYGALGRDPRGHVISVVYLALVPADRLMNQLALQPGLKLARVHVDWPGETGGPATAIDEDGTALSLAFDHAALLGDVVKRLRGKLDYSPVGYAFLPPLFTLREVQEVHEAILSQSLTKPAFRRKLLDRGMIQPTGERETGGAYRPAELYQLRSEKE